MKRVIIFILILYIMGSCDTFKMKNTTLLEKDLKDAKFAGRVISEEGLPIDGVRVKLTGSRETVSDISGYFLFKLLAFGKYNMTFEKEGFLKEVRQVEFNIKNKNQYIYKNKTTYLFTVKMYSTNYLVKEGFEYLKEKDFEKANEIILKLETITPEEEVVLYLKAMYYYLKEIYPQSLMLLEKLKEADRKNIFYQLTLVEVYGKMELHQKQAQLSFYIASSDPKEYYKYYKIAADIYKDKLNNIIESEKAAILYNEYQKKYGND